MKTAKGNNLPMLLDFQVCDTDMHIRIKLANNLAGDITQEMIEKAIPFINDRLITRQKPAATFEKELQRIEHHREQLRSAYLSLWESYVYASTPQTRQSAVDKAKLEMLSAMPDKMLRQFAELYLDGTAQDYILPDEKERLIDATLSAMKVKGD